MKKTNKTLTNLLIALMMLLITLYIVSAGLIPFAISGRIDGTNVEGLSITITNTRSNQAIKATSNYAGEWLIDWDTDYMNSGDVFKIQVDICASLSSQCIVTTTYTGQPTIFTVIDIGDLAPSCPSCPSCSSGGGGGGGSSSTVYECTQELCDTDFPCKIQPCTIEITDCPEDDSVSHEQCNTCCDEPEECVQQPCPDETNIAFMIQAIIIFVGATGGGIKIYKNRAGGVTTIHRHKGILGYHNWNTSHRNLSYKHIAYEDDETKSKSKFAEDLRKINEDGGLI